MDVRGASSGKCGKHFLSQLGGSVALGATISVCRAFLEGTGQMSFSLAMLMEEKGALGEGERERERRECEISNEDKWI